MSETTPCQHAHTPAVAGGRWHPLEEHLLGTAERAAIFGGSFGGADLAFNVGLWHDVGKASDGFQEYLVAAAAGEAHRGPDHKAAGALIAAARGADALSVLVQGHHGGMPNREDARLFQKEHEDAPPVRQALERLSPFLTSHERPLSFPPISRADLDPFLRLLFSCLVDADFLDTEAHFDAPRGAGRVTEATNLRALWDRFADHHAVLTVAARPGVVSDVRQEVYEAVLAAGTRPPGVFRLAVPTGGGKTLSSLAFGLRHALAHGLRRVVVAIPFTSITDQTASIYREFLGRGAVLEHHSAVAMATVRSMTSEQRLWQRLAAENWDAPVVVTTMVQLFESLFSNRPSAARKVHRLASSVVILDEAQTIPVAVLRPTLDMLSSLVAIANMSVVLCTATQPEFDSSTHQTFASAADIVPDPARHFDALRRVSYTLPAVKETWPWARVAQEMARAPQAMAIVNTRRDSLALTAAAGPDALHLSTLLCGAHRSEVLAEVRRRLSVGEACRLVSTQIVEAGVDVDFPLVLRALAPFDSIVQAAGRCNREGHTARGRCVVFRPEMEGMPAGSYATGRDECWAMLREGPVDFDEPETCRRYFRRYYGSVDSDSYRITPERGLLNFATVARSYRIIDQDSEAVAVVFRPRVRMLLAAIDAADPGRARRLLRYLQPYTVGLRHREIDRASRGGLISMSGRIPTWVGPYDRLTGVSAILEEAG